ncbi:hypothetical protein AKJ16_DCAP20615, partial [Drosera capensis]
CSYISAAITSVITVSEILKNNGYAIVKRIATSTIDIGEPGGRPIPKAKTRGNHLVLLPFVHGDWISIAQLDMHMLEQSPALLGYPSPCKIEIVLGKSDNFDDLITASAIEVEDGEEQD